VSIWEKITNLDIRVLWVLMVLAVLIPLIKPLGLPVPIKPETRAAFDYACSLPKGSWVMMAVDISPMSAPECWPAALAMYRHYESLGLRIILFNIVPEGTMYAEKLWQGYSKEYKYEYGKDVVQMPFRAGDESTIAAIGANFRAVYTADQYGTPLDQLPIFDGFHGIQDVALLCDYASTIHPMYYLQQINGKYGTPMVLNVVAVDAPKYETYFKSGQLKGVLCGVASGAEYELLAKVPGPAASQMDALSMGHLLFILAMVLTNISWWLSRGKKVQERGA